MGEPIASAGFISATVAPADRFEAWREAMAPSHDIRPAQAGLGAPQVASIGWLLENLLFSDLAFSPICYCRWRGKSEGNILLRLYEEGQADGLAEEASFQTRPGEIHLFDLTPECRGVTTERHRVKSIFIPYAAVRYDPGRHPAISASARIRRSAASCGRPSSRCSRSCRTPGGPRLRPWRRGLRISSMASC